MTKIVVAFLVGVITGSIGIQLQEHRVERKTSAVQRPSVQAAAQTSSPAHIQSAEAAAVDPIETPIADSSSSAHASRSQSEVPITDAHQSLLSSSYDGTTLNEWHERLEREEKDLDWSYAKEQQLADFFTPPHNEDLAIRSIECRRTMCEIQAFALRPMQQNTVIEDLQRESWYDFPRSFTRVGEHAGSTSVIMYLMREG